MATATLVGHVLLAALVARDAHRRGRSAGRWTLLTLATGLLGALVYRATR